MLGCDGFSGFPHKPNIILDHLGDVRDVEDRQEHQDTQDNQSANVTTFTGDVGTDDLRFKHLIEMGL